MQYSIQYTNIQNVVAEEAYSLLTWIATASDWTLATTTVSHWLATNSSARLSQLSTNHLLSTRLECDGL